MIDRQVVQAFGLQGGTPIEGGTVAGLGVAGREGKDGEDQNAQDEQS
jgi:hypothetical protein